MAENITTIGPEYNWTAALAGFILLIVIGLLIIGYAIFLWHRRGVFKRLNRRIKRLFRSSDGMPVNLSLILQRDACSRLLGEFAENHLNETTDIIIIWKNTDGDVYAESSDHMSDDEAAQIFMKLAIQANSE